MAIWVEWSFGGVQQERIQFNEKRFGLADQAVQSEYTYGNRDGAASHLGSIRKSYQKVINQEQKGNLRNFSQVSKKALVPIKISGTYT